jgi:hypothetical protein
MDLEEIWREGVDWMNLSQDMNIGRSLSNYFLNKNLDPRS